MPCYERKDKNSAFSLFFLKGENEEMLESKFQAEVIRDIKDRLPGCVIIKNDPNYIQGLPDLLVLYKNKWGALECKGSYNSARQPNQEYYVTLMDEMSFSRFIFPQNKEAVLNDLQRSFLS